MTQSYARQPFSPLHERAFINEQRRFEEPYTTEDFQKSVSPPNQISDRTFEVKAWNIPQPSSPSSDISGGSREVPRGNVENMYQTKPEISQKPPREQLPPLSSLFGSAPPQSRPNQSPYSDRHSPVFPSVSPQDGRQLATPIHPDRPFEGSYFQRQSSLRQYSHTSRQDTTDRPNFPLSRPQAGIKAESPRFESRFNPVESSRAPAPTSINGWSPRSDSSRQEHFPRDTSSSFRPHLDQIRSHNQNHRAEPEIRATYREAHAPVAHNFQSTPASTGATDPATTKDGLGPKIWTGTQFLPRFVRQAEVPGEGMCYFYDDGTHCKTVIDGEVVNAHWGVTKAGKPRKRLAIACITCREKKIKCDPDFPRCVQCEKFGRICKFKNAPRGGQSGSPDTPPADPEDILPRPGSSRTDAESFKVEEQEAVSPRQKLCRASQDFDLHHTKRQRNGYNDFTPVPSEASPRLSTQEATSPSAPWAEPTASRSIDRNLLSDWQVDPFTAHPAVAAGLLDVFFRSVPGSTFLMFPEGAFKAWALSSQEKSLDDLMLLYTVLAFGTVFSSKPEHKALGIQYAAISRYACNNRQITIQLVQSRLILAFYYYTINNTNDCWDLSGGAMTAANGLKLNVEIERSDDAFLQTFPYGLNRHGYAECRRRTFWGCYLLDRFNGLCSGHLSNVSSEDIFLRMPCDAKSFETQVEVKNPFFDASTPPIKNDSWTIGSMAYLINIASIWGDVMANIYRNSQRPEAFNSSKFGDFYVTTTARLATWKQSLPQCYMFSTETLARAADSGNLGTYMAMHTVYHSTMMELNRYVLPSSLGALQKAHHISVSQHHAKALLEMMETLAARRISAASTKFSSPFSGYAIVSAIDILSAKVSIHIVPELLASFSSAQSVLAELASFWQSAKSQEAVVLQRVRDLTDLASVGNGEFSSNFKKNNVFAFAQETVNGIFEMREPLEKTFSRDYDCIYA